jgi:hypothetical protein
MDSFSTRHAARYFTGKPDCAAQRRLSLAFSRKWLLTMVQLGLRLNGVTTTLDLEESLAYLESAVEGKR